MTQRSLGIVHSVTAIALCCAAFVVPLRVEAIEAEDVPYTLFSNNAWGSRGGWHLHAARSLRPGTLAMSINDTVSSGSNVLAQGDSDFQATLALSLIWAPYEGLEVGLSQASIVDRYDQVLPSELQMQGNPSLLLKYVPPLDDWSAVGGTFQLTVPTSPGGKGWSPDALTFQLVGIGSLRVHENVEVSANLGYVFDRSSHLFDGFVTEQLERYVYGIDGSENRALYGVSAVGLFDVRDTMSLSPFVELFGQFNGDVPAAQNPLTVSVGGKIFPARSRIVEGSIGVDVRLAGEPHTGAKPAGIPTWRAFAGITLRMGESLPSRDRIWVPRCDINKPCEEGHVCEGFACVQIREVVVEKVVKQEVTKPAEMVAFFGSVIDAQTDRPLAGARIVTSGQQDPVTVDSETGKFNICAMPADGGLVKFTAHALGYVESEKTVTKSAQGTKEPLVFTLRQTGSPVTGIVKGTVSDGATGKLVPGVTISVPATASRIPVASDGTFDASLKVGHYQIFVAAPGYNTQKKELRVQSDAVLVLNIDLQPASVKAAPTKKPLKKIKKPR